MLGVIEVRPLQNYGTSACKCEKSSNGQNPESDIEEPEEQWVDVRIGGVGE